MSIWAYATAAVDATPAQAARLFPARKRLNAAAFRGDRRALAELRRRYGVRFLLVDLSHGSPRRGLDRVLRPVYSNRALQIYKNGA